MQTQNQSLPAHSGTSNTLCQSLMKLLTSMLSTAWSDQRIFSVNDNVQTSGCNLYELTTMWFQLSTRILQFVTPETECPMPVQDLPVVEGETVKMKSNKSDLGNFLCLYAIVKKTWSLFV